MAETLGSLIDKICIAELKLYHMQEQIDRPDVEETHRRLCQERFGILQRQRTDLVAEFDEIRLAWTQRRWAPKVYRQFKMYNDPRFRSARRA